MHRAAVFLGVLALAAGLAGCLGSEDAPSQLSPASANETNATEEDPGQQTVESEPVDNETDASTNENRTDAGNARDEPELVEPLTFREPVRLNEAGYGFEPSIAAGPEGALYATAARAFSTSPPDQRASWLWHSQDGGASWQQVESPQQVHEKQPAFEGDVAVDGEGRLYFVDTYLADNTLSRWSPSDQGPTWDFSRPVQATVGVDDRPWLAAHGDGIVYYLGNNGVGVPTPNNVEEGSPPSRMWFYTSEDGGQTFALNHGFARSWWCGLDASPADDRTVAVMCSRLQGAASGSHVGVQGYEAVVYLSEDRGQTWTQTVLKEYEEDPATGFPTVAFGDEGTPYVVWAEGTGPAQLYVARPVDGAWQVLETTPLEGTIENAWIAAGAEGTVAVTFYATNDTEPEEDSVWHAYAMVTTDGSASEPSWQLTRLSEEPVDEGTAAPPDFFQTTVDPSNAVNVVFARDTDGTDRVLFTRQTAGPNLGS